VKLHHLFTDVSPDIITVMVSIEINNEYFAIFDLNSDISNAGFTNV